MSNPQPHFGREKADMSEERSTEPKIQVVDRRHWARDDDDEGSDTPDKPTYVAELETQIDTLSQERDAVRAQYRAAKSEFENARARLHRDLQKEVELAKKSLLGELVTVVDDLDRAIDAGGSGDGLLAGVEMVRERFLSVLGNLGVEKLQSLGAPFDPDRHEAVSIVPVEDAGQNDTVVGVVKETYVIGDETLRAGQVAVGKSS